MNKGRIKNLENSSGNKIEKYFPIIWRREEGKIAIGESPFILERLQDLGRETVYSPYIWPAVYIEETDKEIIERIEGTDLYLKGVPRPLKGFPEIIWVNAGDNE
jgi:hypothetical protein